MFQQLKTQFNLLHFPILSMFLLTLMVVEYVTFLSHPFLFLPVCLSLPPPMPTAPNHLPLPHLAPHLCILQLVQREVTLLAQEEVPIQINFLPLSTSIFVTALDIFDQLHARKFRVCYNIHQPACVCMPL